MRLNYYFLNHNVLAADNDYLPNFDTSAHVKRAARRPY